MQQAEHFGFSALDPPVIAMTLAFKPPLSVRNEAQSLHLGHGKVGDEQGC
jgi:hypothetical protein